jgi:ribonucleoside-diphosphate reductase beta chain
MKWSVRDESLHSKMGCKLFRDMCSENDQLLHLCREDIIKAAETMIKLETKYIDKMFEAGDVEGIKANDLKHFIKKRANEKLVELGYVDLGSYFAFYHLTGGVTHTDFFAIRPTDYSKANEGEDFDDIW